MGVLKFLKSLGSVESTRESIRISYRKHVEGAGNRCGDSSPHSVGLYGALATRHRLMGKPSSEVEVWAELAPFLPMSPAQAVEALAEYVVFLERPGEAKLEWLQFQVNQSLRDPSSNVQLAALGILNHVPWGSWLDEGVERRIRQGAGTGQTGETPPSRAKSGSGSRGKDALLHYNQGVSLLNSGRREEAIAQFDLCLRLSPDLEEAWFNKGNALHSIGRYEEAIVCYERAPSRYQSWCNTGQALRALGRNEAALSSYEHALRLNADDKITWLNRGVALSKLNRSREALASYDRALALDQDYADAWVNKAGLLGQFQRYTEAYECFDRGLRLNPTDFLGWLSKGNVLSEQERWDEALACFDCALTLNQHLELAWVGKGVCQGKLQRHSDALRSFNMALSLNGENRDAWFGKGAAIALGLENYREALICFQRAHQLGHPSARSMMSECSRVLADDQSL